MRAASAAAFAMAAGLLLAGCGFQPLYGQGTPQDGAPAGAVAADLSRVRIGLIPDRTGQLLRTFLQDGLSPYGDTPAAGYVLDVDLDEYDEEVAFRRDETATRSRLHVIARFSLRDAGTGAVLHGGQSRAVTAYNILDDYYATIVAQEQARRTAAEQIAREIRTRLAVYFDRNPRG